MTGTNVVLLHGLGGSPRIWARVRKLLGTGWAVVAPQLGGTSIEGDALAVAREMRRAGTVPAVVVGHSRGGLVATSLAEQFPTLVERLVLVSTPPTTASRLTARSASERILRIPALGELVWKMLPDSTLRKGLGSAFAPHRRVPDIAVEDLRATGRGRLVSDGAAIDRYLEAGDLTSRLSAVRCPVDIVYGLGDRKVDSAAMALTATGVGRRAFPVANDGHGMPWTSAGAVSDVVTGTARPGNAVGPTPRVVPSMRPRRWTPPPAPARARKTESAHPMGELRRIELPGRGPEDVRIDSRGRVVTGIEDGRILRVTLGADPVVETVANTGGRPLGITVVDDSTLLVCDCDRGVLRVDVDTGEVTVLVSDVDGERLNFASNVVLGASGRVYFTASTRRFGFHDYLADLLEHSGTGRLLVLEPDGDIRTLVDGMQFANGLTISEDEGSATVVETGSMRVARYRLTEDGAVEEPPLVSNLAGFPDNVSEDGDLLWIALANPRDRMFDLAATLPGAVRRLAYSLPESVRAGIDTTWVVAVNRHGDTVYDLQSSSADFSAVTSVVRAENTLVLGSITESALGVVELEVDL